MTNIYFVTVTAMASTNVGLTNVAAAGPANSTSIVFVDGQNSAPVIETGIGDPSAGIANGDKVALDGTYSFDSTGQKTISLNMNIPNGSTATYYDLGATASHFAITDGSNNTVENVSVTGFQDAGINNASGTTTKTNATVTITITALPNSDTDYKLKIGNGTGNPAWADVGTFTIQAAATTPSGDTQTDTPVAAGDVFQIPGGLVANASKQETYTIGVKKIIITGTAGENEVMYNAIVQATNSTDNTLGEWKDAYNTASNLTPQISTALDGKYVLYYSYKTGEGESAVEHPTYVRLLNDTETAALPYIWKTVDNLTALETTDTTDELKLKKEEGVLNAFVKAYIGKYYFNTPVAPADFGTTVGVANDLKALIVTDDTALGGKYDESNDAKKNNGSGYGYVYVPIYLTAKDSTGKTIAYTDGLTMNDIVWTSSNKNLAKVIALNAPTSSVDYTRDSSNPTTDVDVEESDIIKGYKSAAAVAKIQVANNIANHYTGIVTLKGVTKNSKKTINIKINVLDKKRTFVAEYNPQTFANITSSTKATVANFDE